MSAVLVVASVLFMLGGLCFLAAAVLLVRNSRRIRRRADAVLARAEELHRRRAQP